MSKMDYGNRGVIIEVKPTDYVAGWASPIKYEERIKDGDWTEYLAHKERQHPPETFSCVSFSNNHGIDTTMNYLLSHNHFSNEAKNYFIEAGYMQDGRFNSSDRFLAILSGTTKQGNSLQNVLDTVRKCGILPEKDLPFGGTTWEEYHDKKLITQAMKDKAKKMLKYINVAYEWIITENDGSNVLYTLARHLKHAPVQLAIPVCSSFRDGEDPVIPCGLKITQHAIMCYKADNLVRTLDQYEPFLKNLAKNYYIPYALKIVVTSKDLPIDIPKIPSITKDSTPQEKQNWIDAVFNFLKNLSTTVKDRLGFK